MVASFDHAILEDNLTYSAYEQKPKWLDDIRHGFQILNWNTPTWSSFIFDLASSSILYFRPLGTGRLLLTSYRISQMERIQHSILIGLPMLVQIDAVLSDSLLIPSSILRGIVLYLTRSVIVPLLVL